MQETIIVFRIGQLGDTLIAMPAMAEIRRKHPTAKLILLTDRYDGKSGYVSSWDILRPTGWFHNVIFYRPGGGIRGQLNILANLRGAFAAFRVKRIYDLSPDRFRWQRVRDWLIFRAVFGLRDLSNPDAYPLRRSRSYRPLPNLEPEWSRLLRVVGENSSVKFSFPVSEATRRSTLTLRSTLEIRETDRVIAIAPGSKMQSKRWPIDRYVSVCRELTRRDPKTKFFVVGGKEDGALGDYLVENGGVAIRNLAGKLSLAESAGFLSYCFAYIGNDTGTMHLAAMCGVRCIAIFSARDFPGLWYPYGEGHCCLRGRIACEGCMLESCIEKKNECLDLVSVEDVISAYKDGFA